MTSVTLNKVRGEYARAGVSGVIGAAINRPIRWVNAYRELGRRRRFDDSAALLSYTRRLTCGWFDPWQVDFEICSLLDRVRRLQPKTVVEIGTATGGTLFMFTRVAAPDALLISLDLPGGDFGGGYPAWRAPLYRRFALPAQRLELLRGDSHSPRVMELVRRVLGSRPVDFLFIDGDHTYKGVKQDHEFFSPLVRDGGLVGFHDIHPSDDQGTEVPRYWGEIRDSVTTSEWIASTEQQGYGIGVYVVDVAQ